MIGEAKTTAVSWLKALRTVQAARRGENPLRSALRTYRWLRHFPQQRRWLAHVETCDILREAAMADPRLHDRWHRAYISRQFDADARLRIVDAHYTFLTQHFPRRMRERIVRGHDLRVATLRLENGLPAYLHLRKPADDGAGELGIYLLNAYKEVLASCVITFAGSEGLLIGSLRGAWPYMAEEATREFVRGSCGLKPKDLLLSLLRALAVSYGIESIRAVSGHAQLRRNGDSDTFLQAHGGVLTEAGCYDMPLYDLSHPQASSQRRRAMDARREDFRREACDLFLQAFQGYRPRTSAPLHNAKATDTRPSLALGVMAASA
ncbi:MAG TPA: DUF535 family protein [Dyella sp.]|uniref:DUF535 family protein n=1 Tax=Dyella sp. TaxID=1869338 RepID=UPI002F930C87